MQCIAPIDHGLYRCPNLTDHGFFCSEHLEICGSLHSLYKQKCSFAHKLNQKGPVTRSQLKRAITANKQCLNTRENFKKNCVSTECEDEGHIYYYGQFRKIERKEEKELKHLKQ